MNAMVPRTLVLFLVVMLWNLPDGLADLEVRGYYRERVEDGRYNRVISVYASDLDWEAMKAFGKEQEWSGVGTSTVVCFFSDWKNTPDVTFTGLDFSDYYRQYWVAGYYYNAKGLELFVKYPAKKRTVTLE